MQAIKDKRYADLIDYNASSMDTMAGKKRMIMIITPMAVALFNR